MLLKYFLLPTVLLLGAGSAAGAGIFTSTSAQRAGKFSAVVPLPSVMRNASLGSANLMCSCDGHSGMCPSPDDTSCCVLNGEYGCCPGACWECGASDCGSGPAPTTDDDNSPSPPPPPTTDDDNGPAPSPPYNPTIPPVPVPMPSSNNDSDSTAGGAAAGGVVLLLLLCRCCKKSCGSSSSTLTAQDRRDILQASANRRAATNKAATQPLRNPLLVEQTVDEPPLYHPGRPKLGDVVRIMLPTGPSKGCARIVRDDGSAVPFQLETSTAGSSLQGITPEHWFKQSGFLGLVTPISEGDQAAAGSCAAPPAAVQVAAPAPAPQPNDLSAPLLAGDSGGDERLCAHAPPETFTLKTRDVRNYTVGQHLEGVGAERNRSGKVVAIKRSGNSGHAGVITVQPPVA